MLFIATTTTSVVVAVVAAFVTITTIVILNLGSESLLLRFPPRVSFEFAAASATALPHETIY